MKLIILAFAIIGCVAAQFVPDSATQGPNPQDIATPEPEYIDIDEPPPAPAAAPIPVQTRSSFAAAPRPIFHSVQPAASSFVRSPVQSYLAPGRAQVSANSFNPQNGYQYRQIRRRVYYRRRY